MTRRLARAAPVLLGYAAVVAWLTWPLVTVAGSSGHWYMFGPDGLFATWVLTWQSRAIVHAPSTWFAGNIFYPTPNALFYGPMGLGALPLFAPAYWLTGNFVLASNVTFLGGVILTATTLHLVAHGWTRSHAAGAVAGLAFLATRWTLRDWIPGVFHWSALFCMPLVLALAARRTLDTRGVLLLAGLLVLQCATDLVYIAPPVLLCVGVVVLARVVRRTRRVDGMRVAIAAGLALLVLSPLYLGYAVVRAPGLQTPWRWPQRPTELPWGLFGEWPASLTRRDAPPPAALPPIAFAVVLVGGCSVVLRSAAGEARHRRRLWLHTLGWTAIGLVISITPTCKWYGTPVQLPLAAWLERLGVYTVLRAPARLAVVALVGACLMAALGFDECRHRLARMRVAPRLPHLLPTALAAAIAIGFYLESVPALLMPPWFRATPERGYPVRPAPPRASPALTELGAQHGPVLELPSRDPGVGAMAMYRSLVHGNPILNGYSSYWPSRYLERVGVADRLPDVSALVQLHRETGLTRVLVHTDLMVPPESADVWKALADRHGGKGLTLLERDGPELLFAVFAR